MNRQDYLDEQDRLNLAAVNRLAAALERLADAAEIGQGYRFKPVATGVAPEVKDPQSAPVVEPAK